MNLNNHPTEEHLRELLQAVDYRAGIHLVWVDRLGEVQITFLINQTPAECMKAMNGCVQFRYEADGKIDAYMDENAANDDLYIAILFEKLVRDWGNGREE
jgi:hypothetical protein